MFKRILLSLLSFVAFSAQAVTPLFSLAAQTSTTLNLPLNSTAQVKYLLTNNVNRPQTMVMTPIQGVTQDLTVQNACSSPIFLTSKGSCVLALNLSGASIPVSGIQGGPKVCKTKYGSTQPDPFACAQPLAQSQLNVTRVEGAAPTITSITPNYGSTTNTANVTISGTLLADTTSIKFGGVSGTIQSKTDTSVVVTYPTYSPEGQVNVTLTSPYGTATSANGFTYYDSQFIQTVAPNAGSTSGGTSVTLTGTNLREVNSVSFGGSVANIVSKTDTQLDVTTTGHAAGLVDLVLTSNPPFNTYTLPNAFTYSGAPTLTQVSPASGAAGTSVILTGTNFLANNTSVFFVNGGTEFAATNVSVNAQGTSLTATVPAIAGAGTVDVKVTTPAGSVTKTNGFTYGAPVITSFTPTSGPIGGNTTVVVTGSGFANVTSVKLGANDATSYTINSDTQITLVTPSSGAAGGVNINIANAAGTTASASQFIYYGPPTLTQVSPASGSAGTSVILTGTNFIANNTSVFFVNGGTEVAATNVNVVSGTSLTATVPAIVGAGTVDVKVTTPAGSVTKTNGFTYGAPVITSFTPSSGPTSAVTSVTVSGSGFANVTSVKLGTNDAPYTINSDTQITLTTSIGAAAGGVNINIANAAGTTASASQFIYYGPPTLTQVGPASGSAGTSVTLTGTNFIANNTSVFFVNGGTEVAATNVNVVSGTSLTATVPVIAGAGTVDVKVTTPAGSVTKTNGFTYGAPVITNLNPVSGAVAGGNTVEINGSRLANVTGLTVDGSTVIPTIVSDTLVTFTAPNHTVAGAGTVNVVLSNAAGSATTTYTYLNNTTLSTSISELALSVTGLTEYGITPTISGLSRQITITNTGGATATNLNISYPTWPTGTTASSTCGATLAAGATCTITVTPGANATSGCNISHTAPTPGVVTVSSTNVVSSVTTNVVVLGYSCQYQGGYVYAFDDTTSIAGSVGGKVVTTTDQAAPYPNGVNWDGARARCQQTIANYSDWVLPGICEMGYYTNSSAGNSGCGDINAPIRQSIQKSLIDMSSMTSPSGIYWSNTGIDVNSAWAQDFKSNSAQLQYGKVAQMSGVRCSRALTPNPAAPSSVFTSEANPTIASISPNSGGSGALITITGTGFTAGTTVDFVQTSGPTIHAGTSVNVSSPTSLTVTTPSLGSVIGPVDVKVTTSKGNVTLANGYNYTSAESNESELPRIQSLLPEGGMTKGGNEVLVRGYLLNDVTEVRFGDAFAKIIKHDDISMTVIAPAHVEGKVDVVLHTDAESIVSKNMYHYTNLPVITSIQPNSGSINGHYLTSIKGYNLSLAESVSFDGTKSTVIPTSNPYIINVNVPVGSSVGKVDVGIMGKNSLGTVMNAAFEYLDNSLELSQNHLELSVNHPQLNEALTGQARKIIIKNNGTAPITLVHYKVSPALPSGTTITPEDCGDIDVGSSCELTVTPGLEASSKPLEEATPSILTISGDGSKEVTAEIRVLSYGRIFNGGYIFAIDDSVSEGSVHGKVLALDDVTAQDSPMIWGEEALGHSEECIDYEDGYCNSNAFLELLSKNSANASSFAVGACKEMSGTATWFLPAICELAPLEGVCDIVQSVKTTLVDTGILTGLDNHYWSSSVSEDKVWTHLFSSLEDKNSQVEPSTELHVRCASSF